MSTSVPSLQAPSGRARGRLLLALVLLNLATRLVLALRPIEIMDGVTVPDDAYLSLTIAKNIAAGHGPLYGDAPTNGFQPLYVFLMTPVFTAIPNDLITPVHVALVLLSLFDALTLGVLLLLLGRLSTSVATRVVVAVVWILNPYGISNTLNGLETAIACFFMVAALYWFQRFFQSHDGEPGAGPSLGFGLLLGFAVLARIDGAILAFSLGLVLVVEGFRNHKPIPVLLRSLGFIALGALIAYAPWAAYSYAYTGDVYPVSGRAVRFMSLANVSHKPTFANCYWPMLRMGFDVVLFRNIGLLSVAAASFVALLFLRARMGRLLRPGHARFLAAPLLTAVLLFFAYTLYILTPWFFDRYFYPICILTVLVMAILLDGLLSALATRARRLSAATAVILVFLALGVGGEYGLRSILAPRHASTAGYMKLGLWAKGNFEDGTILGSSQTGALGYFADNLKVINLDGVVNERCLESLEARRNMEYIREAGIQYVLGWPVNLKFIANHSTGFRDEDLVLQRLDGLSSWGEEWYLARVTY